MPFNPNEPQNGQIVDADALRGQLTSLKTLIDDLQAQITALAPVFTASGFGDPNANGVYTYAGLHGSRPLYVNPAGYVMYVPITVPPDYWIQAPPLNELISALYVTTTPEPTGPWQATLDGTPPAGIVA